MADDSFPPGPSCRLYALLARDGRSAVVFRRGPSKHVCLIRWWLGSDEIEVGQWLKGRVYERRSDLSQDGELLVYLAAKHKGAIDVWNAISRPPHLKALALWANLGTWGGGGLFEGNRTLGLSVRQDPPELYRDYRLPRDFRVKRVAEWGGMGEDNPIEHVRLERDGWRIRAEGKAEHYRVGGPARWLMQEPEIYEREQPPARGQGASSAVVLRREKLAIGVTDGPWLLHDFSLHETAGELRRFKACDWADWQSNGDLLVATAGKLYRLAAASAREQSPDPLAGLKLVADLAPLRFEAKLAPPAARRWPWT